MSDIEISNCTIAPDAKDVTALVKAARQIISEIEPDCGEPDCDDCGPWRLLRAALAPWEG